MDILKISPITDIDGVSLLPLIEGENNSFSRPHVLSSVTCVGTRHRLVSISKGRYKYIYDVSAKTGELYDLLNDPGEKENLIGTIAKIQEALQLREDLEKFIKTDSINNIEKTGIDKETTDRLKSLGYLQ